MASYLIGIARMLYGLAMWQPSTTALVATHAAWPIVYTVVRYRRSPDRTTYLQVAGNVVMDTATPATIIWYLARLLFG